MEKHGNFIFIDDILRIQYKRNRYTMCNIIDASLKAVFNKELKYYQKGKLDYVFNIDEFLKLFDVDLNDELVWVKNYYKIPQKAEEYLCSHLPHDAVYFSYEAPFWLENIMRQNGFKYIFLRLSYIRYLQDIPILVSSNIPNVVNLLKNKFEFKEHEIIFETDLFKSIIFHNINMPNLLENYSFLENSLVVLGQTDFDTSLKNPAKPDSVIRLGDYKDILRQENAKYDKLFYKPHPYANETHIEYELTLLKEINKNVEIINTNVYEMFSLPYNISFIGLTSSALKEAKYFKKKSYTLAAFPFETEECDDCIKHINVKPQYLYSPKFWQELLYEFAEIKNSYSEYSPFISNMNRNLNAVSWGYSDILVKHFVTTREAVLHPINRYMASSKKIPFLAKIFSIVRDERHIIVRILGFKLSLGVHS